MLSLKVLENILHNIPGSVVVTNPYGIIQYVNAGFTKITGYEAKEIIGKNPRILKSGVHDETFYKNFWDTITSGNDCKITFINKKKSGELYYHEDIVSPIFDQNNEIEFFVSSGKDVTESVEAKEKLEDYCKFIDTIFDTLSSHISTYNILKQSKGK